MNFNIRNYGAVADGKTLNTAAIQAAINACHEAGGGRVIVEGGTYMTGTIVLKGNVDLHLEVNAVLLGSPRCEDYPEFPKKHVSAEKLPRHRGGALIFAEECDNISITGRGTIDANGYSFVEKVDNYHAGWRFRRIDAPTPPRVVFFTGCRNVLVEDVTMIGQPAGWSYWIHDCDYVSFDRVKILADAEFPNNDGIHINSSRNVTVSNAIITTGDDCIVVRANNISLAENKVCEKVAITNCTLTSHTNGIRIGWLNDGTIRNCVFTGIAMSETRTGISITLPSRGDEPLADEGREDTLIENLSFSNITMDSIYLRPVQIDIANCPHTRCEAIRDIYFDNIHARSLGFPSVVGRKDRHVQNIHFTNCTFRKVTPDKMSYYFEPLLKDANPLIVKYADNIVFHNTTQSADE